MEAVPKPPARIADVAARANVGIATVSRVVNDRGNVAPATRERVLEAIRALEYRPSSVAQNLSLKRTLVIGVVLPFLTEASPIERVRGIVRRSRPRRTTWRSTTSSLRIASNARSACSPTPIGPGRPACVSLIPPDEEVRRLRAESIPCVLIDARHDGLPSVVIDDIAGGELATRHLLELGHRSIAFIGDKPPIPSASSRAATGRSDTSAPSNLLGPRSGPSTSARGRRAATSRGASRTNCSGSRSPRPRCSPPRTSRRSSARSGAWPRNRRAWAAVGDRVRRHRDRLVRWADYRPPAALRERPPGRRTAPPGARRRADSLTASRRCRRLVVRGTAGRPADQCCVQASSASLPSEQCRIDGLFSAGGGSRTLMPHEGTPDFKSGAFDRFRHPGARPC